MRLEPKWPMAHIYTGDTLCRLHRPHEAWPYYADGFDIGPNERSLIALALQCIYDEGVLSSYDEQLRALADKHPGSWIAYLAIDTLDNHVRHNGVDPQYRPRGYNEGPKEDKTSESSAEGETTEQDPIAESAATEEVEVLDDDAAADAGAGGAGAGGADAGGADAGGADAGGADAEQQDEETDGPAVKGHLP